MPTKQYQTLMPLHPLTKKECQNLPGKPANYTTNNTFKHFTHQFEGQSCLWTPFVILVLWHPVSDTMMIDNIRIMDSRLFRHHGKRLNTIHPQETTKLKTSAVNRKPTTQIQYGTDIHRRKRRTDNRERQTRDGRMHLGSGVEGELPLKPGVVDCYDHIDRFHLGTVLYGKTDRNGALRFNVEKVRRLAELHGRLFRTLNIILEPSQVLVFC